MPRQKRSHTAEFKANVAIEAIRGRFSVAELSQMFGVHASLIHSWKKAVVDSAPAIMKKGSKSENPEYKLQKDREKQLRQLTRENEWLRKVLMKMSPAQRKAAVEMDNPKLPLLRQVKLLNINRSGVYYRRRSESSQEDQHKIAN